MLTTGSITTETFSAALLGLEDLSLRLTAAALHVAANPEKYPHVRLMLEELSEVKRSTFSCRLAAHGFIPSINIRLRCSSLICLAFFKEILGYGPIR